MVFALHNYTNEMQFSDFALDIHMDLLKVNTTGTIDTIKGSRLKSYAPKVALDLFSIRGMLLEVTPMTLDVSHYKRELQ